MAGVPKLQILSCSKKKLQILSARIENLMSEGCELATRQAASRSQLKCSTPRPRPGDRPRSRAPLCLALALLACPPFHSRAHATHAVTRSTAAPRTAAQLIRAPVRPSQLPHVRQLTAIGPDDDKLDVWTTPTASSGPLTADCRCASAHVLQGVCSDCGLPPSLCSAPVHVA